MQAEKKYLSSSLKQERLLLAKDIQKGISAVSEASARSAAPILCFSRGMIFPEHEFLHTAASAGGGAILAQG